MNADKTRIKPGDRRNVHRFLKTRGQTERSPGFYSSKEPGKLENVPSVPGFQENWKTFRLSPGLSEAKCRNSGTTGWLQGAGGTQKSSRMSALESGMDLAPGLPHPSEGR